MVVSNKVLKKRRAERSLPKTKKSPKNRIRDLKRRLVRGGIDAEKAASLQQEIDALTASEAAASAERRRIDIEKKYATKYHKVKFFERRKLDRKLARVRREKSDDDGRRERELLQDLDYVKYYPKGKKYISLFVENDEDPKTPKLRAKMRALALEAAEADRRRKKRNSPGDDDDDDAPSSPKDEEDDYFVTI